MTFLKPIALAIAAAFFGALGFHWSRLIPETTAPECVRVCQPLPVASFTPGDCRCGGWSPGPMKMPDERKEWTP